MSRGDAINHVGPECMVTSSGVIHLQHAQLILVLNLIKQNTGTWKILYETMLFSVQLTI